VAEAVERRARFDEVTRFPTIVRAAAAVAWAAVVIFFAEPRPVWAWLGAALIVAGEALRLWAAGYGAPWEGKTAASGIAALPARGPYAWVRNPKHIGGVAVAVGLAAWAGGLFPWLPLATATVSIFLYSLIQAARDRDLGGRTSWEYRAYRGTVPIWLPRFARRAVGSPARWRFGAAFAGEWAAWVFITTVAAAAHFGARVATGWR
jgi:protein-S-isoprenylcysteine O-methyltransferase Ste14